MRSNTELSIDTIILPAAISLSQAFNGVPGIQSTIQDNILVIKISIKTLGAWTLTWHSSDGDDYGRYLDFRSDGTVKFYDDFPEDPGSLISLETAVDYLNKPFDYGTTGWEAEFYSVTDPRFTGLVDLALALASVTKLNEEREHAKSLKPHPVVIIPTQLVWEL